MIIMVRPAYAMTLVAGILALGACGPGSMGDQALRTFDTVTTGLGELDPLLRQAYDREQKACMIHEITEANMLECMDRVTKAWQPAISVMTTIRKAWCTFDPTYCQEPSP